jgi:UDP-N-acetylmuramoyl-tripeptide--D-alanyl-D-alanine ligase
VTLAETAECVDATPIGPRAGTVSVSRITIDSRDVRTGDLFWAIVGERFDGHDFVPQALAAGATAAVVHRDVAANGAMVRVVDTRTALGRFAAWYRQTCKATVVGVTGSVGKTSTREAIHAVLSQRRACVRSIKNFNNDIGVPLSLVEVGPRHEYAVIEMGASHVGEIARLAAIARPQIGVVTAVGEAHLEGFGSVESVAAAKAELVAALGNHGTAVLNADDERVRRIGQSAECRVVWFGTQPSPLRPFTRAVEIEQSVGSVSFRIEGGPRVTLSAPGRHQVYAALAAAAVGRIAGLADRDIVAGLERYRPVEMRCQVERLGAVTVINDAYNACPPSMQAALDVLHGWATRGRRVLVCGDMKELGPRGPHFHQQLGREIARRRSVDCLVAVGPLSASIAESARAAGMDPAAIVHCGSIDEAAGVISRTVRPGDLVLIKGSRAMQLEKTLDPLRERFKK